MENLKLRRSYENTLFDWRNNGCGKGVVYQPKFSRVDYKKNLLDECHELLTKGNGNPVVTDYKETEFDYSQLKIMPASEALKLVYVSEVESMRKAMANIMLSHAIDHE